MKKRDTKITDLMSLLVFALFAVCVLLVLLYGARVYQNLVRRGDADFQFRTATQYVSMRIRQAEKVNIADFEGCEALEIREMIDGDIYMTRVYCYDGYIRELFCAENASLQPDAGEKIMPAESLCFFVDGDLLTALVDGYPVLLSLQGKTGGAP